MAKRICDGCGCEADEYWMMSYNPGTGLKWFCWDCYKQSQYEANKSDQTRLKRLYQIAKSKQRIK